MSKQVLKAFNSLKKIILSVFSGILIALSGCGDLVEETDTEACKKAIDERDYETATSACTSRKDRATAWMGRAGYDIVNLIKASSSAPSAHTKPSSLGKDDPSGAVILNILQLSTDVYSDDTERAEKIKNSKEYLDKASEELHKYISDNSSPLSIDELLLNTYALAFAMQLDQTIIYDNGTTVTSIVPSGSVGGLSCEDAVDVSDSTEAKTTLKPMDGHIWTKERHYIQCLQIITAIESVSSEEDKQDVIDDLGNWTEGSELPEDISEAFCAPLSDVILYLGRLTESITEIGNKLNLTGDNTKVITETQTATNTLLKQVGCEE
jgi:hypothetical protein